ncbi:MAG TPA: TRAP transporter substrate-binding protein DctP [Paenalcaligenes hominis]|uniref:TRAP transporter substrate-binding protein DctP n=1 Tax=Paenalcaligenes hominis TaxID=643674 RepID=A0A9D2VFL4_9BURK|nr:TRAP transporter substrate-binding protein DctP [Paenalcaligenes hominis]
MLKQTSKLLLGLALCFGAWGANAEQATLKAVSAFGKDTFFNERFEQFVEKVNEEGKGLLQIQVIGGPEAIPTFEVGNAVRSGVVDFANTSAVFHANLVPEALAMTLTDRRMDELRANGGYDLMNQIHTDKSNMIWLARVTDGLQYHLYVNKPIDKADLKGFKIRSTPVYLALLRNLGATALQISPGETYTALERGVVDGYGWPSVGLLDLGWQEKTKYRVEPGFYNVEVSFFINKNSWEKLNDEQKAFLQKQVEWVESLNQPELERGEKEKKRQEDAGIEVISLSEAAATDLLDKAYAAGWENIHKVSPNHAADIEKLFGRD